MSSRRNTPPPDFELSATGALGRRRFDHDAENARPSTPTCRITKTGSRGRSLEPRAHPTSRAFAVLNNVCLPIPPARRGQYTPYDRGDAMCASIHRRTRQPAMALRCASVVPQFPPPSTATSMVCSRADPRASTLLICDCPFAPWARARDAGRCRNQPDGCDRSTRAARRPRRVGRPCAPRRAASGVLSAYPSCCSVMGATALVVQPRAVRLLRYFIRQRLHRRIGQARYPYDRER